MTDTKILVAEDKAVLAQDLMDRLHHLGFDHIMGPFAEGEQALKESKLSPPDIALLDITLRGEMSGIQLAAKLNADRNVPIVYLTHHQDDRILESTLSTNPVAFINKPYTNNELRMAVINAAKLAQGDLIKEALKRPLPADHAMEVLEDRIFVRNGRGKTSIFLKDILWIQSGGGETSAVVTKERLAEGKGHYPTVGYHLSKLEAKLSFFPHLVRCSRYHIINLKQVERILDDKTGKQASKKSLLIQDEEIPVGEKYRKDVMSKLHIF